MKILNIYTVITYSDRVEWRNEIGEEHCLSGPAIVYKNGDEFYFVEGKRHRENGAACRYADGTKFWFLNDIEYSKQEFNKIKQLRKK